MIYFDNASSSRPSKKALDIFYNASVDTFANPSSYNSLGITNMVEINRFKTKILKLLCLNPSNYEVIFTSGATESNNLAILGYARRNKNKGNHIITSKVEHESVLNTCLELAKEGFKVDFLSVDENGNYSKDELNSLINDKTILICLMGSNNESGYSFDLNYVAELIKKYPKCQLYSDLAQSFGKIKINFSVLSMFSFTAHKINGIKGIALLVKKKNINLDCIIYGGNQQDGLRSGTIDYPAIASFAYTIEDTIKSFNDNFNKVKEISDFLKKELGKRSDIALNNADCSNPYIVSFSLKNKKASVVVEALSNKDIYVNSVSACNSKTDAVSHVIYEMFKDEKRAREVIRLSLSHDNTLNEAEEFITTLNDVLASIRG